MNHLCAMLLFLAFFFFSTFISCSRGPDQGASAVSTSTNMGKNEIQISPDAASGLQVEPVTLQPEDKELVFSGKIQYDDDRNRSSRLSSPVAGKVIETRAKLGDRVSEGDPLLVIESPDIGTAYSDYVKAHSDLLMTQRSQELAKDLYEGKAISRKDLQQAENDAQKARAEFFRAKERLQNLHIDPADLERPVDQQKTRSSFYLRSPLTGIVVERNVTTGQMVGNDPTQILFTVANLTTVLAVADLSDKDLTRVTAGDKVEIQTDAYPDKRFTGRITYISEVVDPATRTFKFRCRVENTGKYLKPEMFVRISLAPGRRGGRLPAVPASALVHEGDRDFVFVQISPNRFTRRMVSLDEIKEQKPDQYLAIIRQGLNPGEEVVTEGSLLLENLFATPA